MGSIWNFWKGGSGMHACARTDIGRKRQSNQDTVFCSEEPVGKFPNLFLVADGMGGHKAGGFASHTTVEMLLDLIRSSDSDELILTFKDSISQVNRQLYDLSRNNSELSGMGTTLVGAVLTGSVLTVANVGDSRLYVSGEDLKQITRDHSLVEELVTQGRMIRGSDEYLSRKNVITRAVGVGPEVTADFFEVELKENERILLCSDGLANMVTDEEIQAILTGTDCSADEKVRALIDTANENGGYDNITAVLIEQ